MRWTLPPETRTFQPLAPYFGLQSLYLGLIEACLLNSIRKCLYITVVAANLPHDWAGRERIDPSCTVQGFHSWVPLGTQTYVMLLCQMLHPDEEYRDEEADDEAKRDINPLADGERRGLLQSVNADADVSVALNYILLITV